MRWKPATDSTKVSGQILYSGQITVPNPRFHGMIYGFDPPYEQQDEFAKFRHWVAKQRAIEESIEGINGT